MRNVIVTRVLSLVWDDGEMYKSVPLKEVTQELYDKWTNELGSKPKGKMAKYLTF